MLGTYKKERLFQGIIDQIQIHGVEIYTLIGICAILEVILCIPFGILNMAALDNEGLGLELFGVLVTIAAIFTLIISIIMFSKHYNMGIKMSRSRNEMMIRLGAIVSIFHLVILGTTFLISRIAVSIYCVYNPVSWGIDKIPLCIWLGIVLGPMLLGMFVGGVVSRFGKKGSTFLYYLFCSICIASNIILSRMSEVDVIEIYVGDEVIPCLFIVLFVSGIYMLKKTEVK